MFTASISVDGVIEAVAAFLQPYCAGAQIVQAQTNRVAMPPSPCVVLTPLNTSDIATPRVDTLVASAEIRTPTKFDVQVDFYGALAGDYCRAVSAVIRSSLSTSAFAAGITPLYCSDGIQSPLTTGEQQYENRWTTTISLQWSPVVTVPQESGGTLALGTINAVI